MLMVNSCIVMKAIKKLFIKYVKYQIPQYQSETFCGSHFFVLAERYKEKAKNDIPYS